MKMIRAIFISLVTFVYLDADILDDNIKNILGTKEYKIHKNLITLLFKDRDKYIINEKIRYHKVFSTLKQNGLLDLELNKPSNITLEFRSVNKNAKAYKMLNDTLKALGYRYFFTNSLTIDENSQMLWKISFKTEYMIDPVFLLKELQQKNCKILKVEKKALDHWYYELDFNDSFINQAYRIEKDEKVSFQKPLQEYMLEIEDVKTLQVISKKLNNWYPYIVFFDKDLRLLNIIKKNRIYKGYKTKIPPKTKYIKISDMYNLINIKRGLSIIVR
ncbi:MAG: hypothetical protein U9Q33_02980 [Campylobacterota bacterium]|nr:hypothetical protein [Campylobacterota bacterium]